MTKARPTSSFGRPHSAVVQKTRFRAGSVHFPQRRVVRGPKDSRTNSRKARTFAAGRCPDG